MCGIAGYTGYQEATSILLAALKKLEYRGYDSAGIAVLSAAPDFSGANIEVRKTKGPLSALEAALENNAPAGKLGIGHTRWATHGEPSDINSHPHTDVSGSIAVVHNGIIENYAHLKSFLRERGVVFRSETDTEVIAHLIDHYYQNDKHPRSDPLLRATLQAISKLEGSYALGVIARDFPDRLIAVRKDSPLIVGLGKNENFIASDAPALLAYTRDVYFLRDNEIAVLYNDHVDMYNNSGEKILRESQHIDWDVESAEKAGFAHFMLKEIHEQPKALRDTLNPRLGGGINTAANVQIHFDELDLPALSAQAKRIVITACGTAYHAGVVGKYAFEHFARLPVETDIASEYRYRDPLFDKNDLFIIISQSGETADTLAALRLAKEHGAKVIAITNAVGSTISREADTVLYTRAGPEIAVASTKAFTTQLMCLYLLALELGRLRGVLGPERYAEGIAGLQKIPENAAKILEHKEAVQRYAARQFNKKKVFFLGRLFDYAVSMESALKLKEISYTHSESFAAGELKHGPIALVDKDTLVVTFATQETLFSKITSNVREVLSRGAASLIVMQEPDGGSTTFLEAAKTIADEIWTIPRTAAPFTPLLTVIYMQLFAYYCSVSRGNDPDKPRNLAKSVTVE
ncbi:MAG: glutamine--fructose-6-phosphate transaminase (isomerizing) [Spirochaetaceae bacterium]|jgi:glucosamine--fructose-6-phosphate aminotransferase (isomerizing)|nr:glutamine--fructose-6-phosphate transaminase (isomerizing) [Spirochaetaceae bacterium]